MKIPEHIFKYKHAIEQIKSESDEFLTMNKIEWNEKGLRMHIIGAQFPMKGYATPEVMWTLNVVKKNIIEMLKIITMPVFIPGLILAFVLPGKVKRIQKMLESYNRSSHSIMNSYILENRYQTAMTQEIIWFLSSFLQRIGINELQSTQFAEVFSHIFEYDNAYRYRLQDILSEATEDALVKRPIREIWRLFRVYKTRDHSNMHKKIGFFAIGAILFMLYPKFRRAFKDSLQECEFEKFQFDKEDLYWVSFRKDYLYQGMEQEERHKIQKKKGYKFPKFKPLC